MEVNSDNWKDALDTAFPGLTENVDDNINQAQEDAFNQDWLFAVVAV